MMEWLLGVIILLLVLALAYAGKRIEEYQRALATKRVTELSEAHIATVKVIWDKVRAQTLRDAADDWPSVDAEAERKRLSWVQPKYGAEDQSMVVRWLNLRADQIEGYPDGDTED